MHSLLREHGEQTMTDVSIASLGARLRQVRRDAARRGMVVRKTRNDPKLHRYIIVGRDPHIIKLSNNPDFPYSFSLEETEAYFAQ
jgi:hypothetical protein